MSSSEMRMPTGPNEKVKKILVAGLDENDKPVFTTLMVGTLKVNVESDRYDTYSPGSDMVVSSWDYIHEYEIVVRGRPVE